MAHRDPVQRPRAAAAGAVAFTLCNLRQSAYNLRQSAEMAGFAAMDLRVAQAFTHFDLGRRGNEALPADPIAWLTAQLLLPDPARIESDPAPGSAAALEVLRFD